MMPFFRSIISFFSPRRTSGSELEMRLGYQFRDSAYLTLALSHRSYSNEISHPEVLESNERLEFLGDAVLDLVMTEHLYRHYPDQSEGTLSKMKSLIVSSKVLELCAKKWELGRFILLSAAEKKSGGSGRPSIVADAYEAVLGAVYLDGGLEPARRLIHKSVIPIIDEVLEDEALVNYKSELLELTQAKGKGVPAYRVISDWGPEHRKTFRIGVYIQDEEWGRGEGRSKKEAEQAAGRMALERYRQEADSQSEPE